VKGSHISWTDDTWNPWYGCTPVSKECDNCYIDRILKQQGLQPWGTLYRAKSTWGEPEIAQHDAVKQGKRCRMFTCSLSDFFHQDADKWRDEAWDIIRRCPNVDFLILTKRAERIERHLPLPADWGAGWPNVWLGVSVGAMKSAWRVDYLRKIRAVVRFISAEPLLDSLAELDLTGIQWLIAGGESGPKFRHMNPMWAEELRLKCDAANVTFFFKQDAAYKSGIRPKLLGQVYHNWPTRQTIQPAESVVTTP
jgi:protein gp37